MLAAGALERDLALGVAVGDLDAYAVVAAQAQDVGGGARVDDGVGDQFAGEDHGVVDDVGEAPALQGVADEGAGGRDRAPHGLEGGGRARGDHRTPRPVVDVQAAGGRSALLGEAVPVGRGSWVLPRDAVRWSWCGCPSDACPLVLVPPPRPDGPAWLDSRMQGYLPSRPVRMPVAGVSARECADGVRSCRTVMAWFGHGVKHWAGSASRQLEHEPGSEERSTLREGHGGVWRSGAGHETRARKADGPEQPGRDDRGGHGGPEPAAGGAGGDAGRQLPQAADGVRRRRRWPRSPRSSTRSPTAIST